MKMKIALLSMFFPPKWLGGIEVITQNLVTELAKNKKNQFFVITKYDRGLKKRERINNFFVNRISCTEIKRLQVLIYMIKAIFEIKKLNPDIVHCQSTIPGLAAFFSRKPYIVYCHGSDVYLASPLRKKINNFVLRHASQVISLTKDMWEKIKNDYNIDSIVIPNGIDTSKYKLNRKKIRQNFGLKNEKIILYIGTLKPVKGVKYLIAAFKKISEEFPNTKLFIVGDGSERPKLEKLSKKLRLEDKVIFFGKKSNDEIPNFAIASDILVLPSLSESFGVTLLEAMAAGLPIVASKVGGVPEIIKEGRNGFLVKPKNPAAIADRLKVLLENPDIRKKISRNNLKDVKKYSWNKIAKEIEKIYEKITSFKTFQVSYH
jgi:N-acetyl-alpha-D-glucosaminyl L-malate synthase BshA